MTASRIEIPIRTESVLNKREHWAVGMKRKQSQQRDTHLMLMKEFGINGHRLPKAPYYVTLTRIGRRKLDTDNLAASFKAIRDEIAKFIGIDDGDDEISFEYAQEIGKEYGISIEIEGR